MIEHTKFLVARLSSTQAKTLWDNSPKYTNPATRMEYIKVEGNFYFLRKTRGGEFSLVKSGALNMFDFTS